MVITIGNVFSHIDSCTKEEYLAFRECLTYVVPNSWFSSAFKSGVWDGKKRFFKNKSFPTGLLHIVLEALPNTIIRQARQSNMVEVNSTILKNKSMLGKYAYQATTVAKMLRYKRGIVSNVTGSGKTVIAAAFLQTLQYPSLFLTHQKELAKQTVEVFKEEMSLPIGLYGSGTDDRQLITVGMVPTISRRLGNREVLNWLETLEVVLVDEAHLSSANTFIKVLEACTNAQYRIGLSGTPLERGIIDNIKVQSQLGHVITEVRSKELIESNVLSKPIITMLPIPSEGLDGDYPEVYTKGIIENKIRNEKIVEITKSLLEDEHKVLILVKRISHGKLIQKLFSKAGIFTAFCHGESTEEEREKEINAIKNGSSNILILSKIGQVGLDIPALSAGVFALAGKSTIEVIQSLGRFLRIPESGNNKVLIYDFYDNEEKYLKEHSEKRKEAYENEGYEVTLEQPRVESSV